MLSEITLSVETPDVTDSPIAIGVRCGLATCEVREYGRKGSGDWAVWISDRNTLGDSGAHGHTLDEAMHLAREYVKREELSRLLHAQLRDALATSEWEANDDSGGSDG